MNDPLSISAAARDAGSAVALVYAGTRYTFGELADRASTAVPQERSQARRRVVPLLATNTLEAVVALYALLDARVPVLLMHPKSTEAERAAQIAAADLAAQTLPNDAAVILHTSGTTAQPRGVVLTRSALLASAHASASNLGWQPDDCWLAAMPIARIGGLSILTRCLIARRRVALFDGFDAERLPASIEATRATLVSLVPTMLALAFERHPAWTAPPFLRAVLVGGAAASPRLLGEAARRGLPVVITYGCTETSSQVVATPYASRFAAADSGVGRPLAGAEVRTVDERIEVRGAMRMAGYLGEAPLASDAWFDTGDLGQFDPAGNLHMLARRHDLIVTGGDKVAPLEVERALETVPGIRAAAVFGVPDEIWGEIVAAIVVAAAAPPSDAALRGHLDATLARHKRPRRIAFVDELPLTAAGKVDRAALAALATRLRPLGDAATERG